MTQEEMMKVIVDNKLGKQITLELLKDDSLDYSFDQKYYEPCFFTVLLENDDYCMFMYFDENETYSYNKNTQVLTIVSLYQEVIEYYLCKDNTYYNEEMMYDYINENDLFIVETKQGMMIIPCDMTNEELNDLGIIGY